MKTPTTKTVVKSTGKKLTADNIARGIAAKQELGMEGHNPASWVEDEDVWEKAKAAADKDYQRGDDAYWPVVAHIYENMGGSVKEKQPEQKGSKAAKASLYGLTDKAVRAAHGEVTGKASFSTIRQKLQEAVESDERFPHYTPEVSPGQPMPYPYKPYVVDVLAPDDDGTMEAVVCCYGDHDGDGDVDAEYYRIGFEWDGDTNSVTLEGEPQETESSVVYSKRAEDNAKMVKAAWSDEAHEAAAEARRKSMKASSDAEHATHVAEHETSKVDSDDQHGLTREDKHDRRADLHENAADFHSAAADKHDAAAKVATSSKQAMAHSSQAASHRQSASDHRFAAKDQRDRATKMREMHNEASQAVAKAFVRCEASGVLLGEQKKWEMDKPVRFQFMPGGKSTIQAGWGGRSVRLTVECDEDTAKAVQASYESHLEANPRRVPFGCIEHREEEAFITLPKGDSGFEWLEDPEPGVYCTAMPTELGAKNVNGRIHSSFSPTFATDAEYEKSVCVECRRREPSCECVTTMLDFPDGARGSRSNPARITAVNFSVGSLTNKPAFRNILPVRAKQAASPQPVVNKSGTNQQQKGKTMKVMFVKARGTHKAGDTVDLEHDDPAVLEGDAMHPVSAKLVLDNQRAVEAAAAERKANDHAKIDQAVDRAVKRGALTPKGDEKTPGTAPFVTARMKARYDQKGDIDSIVELVDYMVAAQDTDALTNRWTAKVGDDDRSVRANEIQFQGVSLREAGSAYVEKRKDMDKMIRLGGKQGMQDALNCSLETGAILKAHIMRHMRDGRDFMLKDAFVRAAGLDVADPDSQVGTLATGLVIMRNLGFLKSKLGFLPYISTDLRNEPVMAGQTLRTRYIVPPALLTFVPGVGYTRDTTTISNAGETTSQSDATLQTSGTRTSSMGSTSTKGDSGTQNAVDVDVKLDQHKGVEVEFSVARLAATARSLFGEQQGAQFYALAEGVNNHFLATLFAATWTGTVNSFSLGPNWGLPGMVALKDRMSLSRLPDTGRFAVLHSYYYDKLLVDTNLLTAKAILALINKDASEFEQADVPPLFGVKPIETQLATYSGSTYTAPNISADGSSIDFVGANVNRIGFAGNSASMLFVARVPLDYTKAFPDVPATATIEVVTEPDSGLSVMFRKYVNHTTSTASALCALMWGFKQGDPRQGILLTP